MNLKTERMYHAGVRRPENGSGFGDLFQDGFYLNYLHGLDFLCRKHINKETKVLELGCFYGASSELFSTYSDNVTCVDIEKYHEMTDVLNRTKIKFHQKDSIEFLKNISIGDYDIIYIDTTHDFGRTKEEILLSYSKLNIGQKISGHDYNSHGVYNAILSAFEYPDVEIYLDSSWCITKTENLKLK
jgi:SAM-dependent methyltransferase